MESVSDSSIHCELGVSGLASSRSRGRVGPHHLLDFEGHSIGKSGSRSKEMESEIHDKPWLV
jgi:hypothetical protein